MSLDGVARSRRSTKSRTTLQPRMETGTRNPLTRPVLPDRTEGVELVLYPWVR
jgi:hypothetical protein